MEENALVYSGNFTSMSRYKYVPYSSSATSNYTEPLQFRSREVDLQQLDKIFISVMGQLENIYYSISKLRPQVKSINKQIKSLRKYSNDSGSGHEFLGEGGQNTKHALNEMLSGFNGVSRNFEDGVSGFVDVKRGHGKNRVGKAQGNRANHYTSVEL